MLKENASLHFTEWDVKKELMMSTIGAKSSSILAENYLQLLARTDGRSVL